MDKITGVINNNLRSVIDGIRQHLSESESLLEKINMDMDKKISLAQEYKEEVSESKDKINNIEDEIDGLEQDLNDLNAKFGDTDFKEILSAGNKEINTKIIEKRGLIQRESQKILNLTEKARQLKEDLIDLREKKSTLEYDIKETNIVEKYYSNKVNEIIDFVEAGNDLETYIKTLPQAELMTNTTHEETLVEVSKVLDDHVFDEIDEITSNEPDESLVEEALKNVVNVTYIMDAPKEKVEFIKPEETKEQNVQEPIEFTPVVEVTSKVEDGISDKTFKAITTVDLIKKPVVEEVVQNVVEPAQITFAEPVVETSVEETKPVFDVQPLVEAQPVEAKVEEVEETKPLSLDEIIEKTVQSMSYPSFDDSSIDLNLLDDDVIDDEEEVKDILPGEEQEINLDDSNIEINVTDDEDEKNNNSTKVNGEYLSSIGFDSSKIKSEDIKNLMEMEKSDLDKKIEVLKKYNLDLSSVYENVNVLTKMKVEDIDSILTILSNVSKEDLSLIVPAIDKIDINKLKESVEVNKDKSLIDIIVPAVDNVNESIKDLLSMTDEELDKLKSSVSEEIYKKMNIIPNVVVENYNVLNNLGIDNIRDCLTKYPTKLLSNPKDFKAVLDKYDQEDLVRCINKNAKVFEKI